ncbi:hypothetical protein DRJ16_00070 [Candidatus Woesearchaeota archaeon]|nr:MAG: hypothetical protein DRJ16_00070 [Candidatus Woesearchaeota archaeon]
MKNNTTLLPRSIDLYARTIQRFLREFKEASVENANKFIAKSFREKRSYYVKYAFMHYFKYLGREEDYKKLIKTRLKPKKKKGCFLRKEELERIAFSLPTEEYRMVAIIQYLTGARAHDVLTLSKDRITKEDGMLKLRMIQKGEREKIAFIPEEYAEMIWNFVQSKDKEYPFLRGESKDFTRSVNTNYTYYYRELKEVATSLGYENFATHDFRRNFINDAYSKFKDIRIVRVVAGHSDMSTTLRYLLEAVDEKEIKKAIKEIRG